MYRRQTLSFLIGFSVRVSPFPLGHAAGSQTAPFDLDLKIPEKPITNFRTSNSPDVHVHLIAAPDAKDDATVKSTAFVDLGILKGNIGDQNYDVPNSVDLGKYRASRSGASALT
jgi:hypothetical protein